MSKEFSAIDAIHQILSEIKEIKQHLILIDNNIKLLNNKINNGNVKFNKTVTDSNLESEKDNSKLIKVFSKVKNSGKKPIKDVYITIFDPKGNIVKTRVTDVDGYWEARIPPGQYVVEINPQHINKKFNPININIDVTEHMHEFEVRNTV